jgi:hypothetical protein
LDKCDVSSKEKILEKLKEIAKDKAKEELKKQLEELARKAGATDGQICQAEHCATAGPYMSVCLLTHCEDEILGTGKPK